MTAVLQALKKLLQVTIVMHVEKYLLKTNAQKIVLLLLGTLVVSTVKK